MRDKKSFGLFIKEKRIEKNYSQKELADLLYVTVSAVSKWERGVTYPDITLISDICRVLDVTEHELIESSNDEEYRKIKKDANKYNKIKKTIFWIFNIIYSIAVLTCFIVNIAVNHKLSWSLIVFSSILTAYTYIPSITWLYKKYKGLIFIGSTFISTFILFLTICIYTNDYWFMIPTIGLLLFYFIIIYPIIFRKQKNYLDEEKYKKLSKYFLLTYSVGIFVLISLLLISINIYYSFNLKIGLILVGGLSMFPILLGLINLLNNAKVLSLTVTLSLVSVLVLLFVIGFGKAIYMKSTEVINTYVLEEEFNNINIDVKTSDINIYLSNTQSKLVVKENKKISIDKKIINNTLSIEYIDTRKFYDKLISFSNFQIDLYLTKEQFNLLNIKCSTGDILLEKGFVFDELLINNSTGDIDIKSNVLNNINISNSTGDIELENINSLCNINLKTSTGDIELENINCNKIDIEINTGDTKLKDVILQGDLTINGKTGDVELYSFDSNNINISLSTGNIKGTILTTKFYICKSKTGKVLVPETREGGECRITVSTGDIIINNIVV